MATTPTAAVTCPQLCRTSTCPSWLQAALADIEQRVNQVALTQPGTDESDSFADRAEFYYEKRPQLVSLLHDLHHRYLQLADRYSQSLLRRTHSPSPSISPPDSPTSSAAESAISFQPNNLNPNQNPNPNLNPIEADLDFLIAELVITGVEREILVNEINESDRYRMDADRRMELQRSLVEVLESEREVLAGENARVGFRAAAAEAEARGLAAEVGWMRRRAGELARAVVKLREDHRVCLLSRRIEGLQAQIYALERRNGECYEAMKKREVEKGEEKEEMERLKEENRRLKEETKPPLECNGGKEKATTLARLNLKLDYSEVMKCWADKDSPFGDSGLPESSADDLLMDLFLETENGVGGGREACVQRYKEKRRTRLFSKKIRYQVRKVNADRRPRMKGRFVKSPALLHETMEEESL